jgi:hypothetical protein
MATNTYVALQSTTLGSDVASYDFTSIPSTYTDLLIIGQFGNSGAGNAVGVQFNSDTGNNYSFTALVGNGSSATSDRLANTNHIYTAYNIAPSATVSGVLRLNVQNYSNTTTNKTVIARYDNNDATFPGASATAGLWRNTAAITSIRIKPSAGNLKAGSTFSLYGIAASGVSPAAKATGGAIYSDDLYYYHVFGSTGTFTPLASLSADALVVAGGGGGGMARGGGGGAGGITYYASQSLTATGYTCTVGGGGAGGAVNIGAQGGNSQFAALTASVGGGFGGSANGGTSTGPGGNGGSGGGGAGSNGARAGGTGTSGQGNAGGSSPDTAPNYGAGGGGGFSAAGAAGTGTTGGDGGAGTNTYSTWLTAIGIGVSGFIAGGGGGGTFNGGTAGIGQAGGGSATTNNTAGTAAIANTGSGGGGGGVVSGSGGVGGNGGSGVVIVRYLKA